MNKYCCAVSTRPWGLRCPRIEVFACSPVQYRARDPASRGDRYMLVSFDDPPNAIKVRHEGYTEGTSSIRRRRKWLPTTTWLKQWRRTCFSTFLGEYQVITYFFAFEQIGWKENHPTFVLELKNLRATGISTFGRSLKEAIDLLSVHRLHTGIDHYGQVNDCSCQEFLSQRLWSNVPACFCVCVGEKPVFSRARCNNFHYRWRKVHETWTRSGRGGTKICGECV